MANILFGFVSNEASLQHFKTHLKLPQNIAILPNRGNPVCHFFHFFLSKLNMRNTSQLIRTNDYREYKMEEFWNPRTDLCIFPWCFFCIVLVSHVLTCNYAVTCLFIFQFVCVCIFWSSRILAGNYVCLSASVLRRLRASSNTRERHRHHLCDPLNDDTKVLTETETFFPIPNFPKPILYFQDQILRNRYFISETKFSETETDTLFLKPKSLKPKPRLFSETKFSETDTEPLQKLAKVSYRDQNRDFSISMTIFGEIFSKYFPPFPSLFFLSSRKKDILFLRIFSSFFFSVFLLLRNRTSTST